MNRKSIIIQRLSFGSLFTIYLLGGLGFCVPFCALGALVAIFAPERVRLQEGATMGSFYIALILLPVSWPLFFALFFSCATWIAFKVKNLVSHTTIEVVEPE